MSVEKHIGKNITESASKTADGWMGRNPLRQKYKYSKSEEGESSHYTNEQEGGVSTSGSREFMVSLRCEFKPENYEDIDVTNKDLAISAIYCAIGDLKRVSGLPEVTKKSPGLYEETLGHIRNKEESDLDFNTWLEKSLKNDKNEAVTNYGNTRVFGLCVSLCRQTYRKKSAVVLEIMNDYLMEKRLPRLTGNEKAEPKMMQGGKFKTPMSSLGGYEQLMICKDMRNILEAELGQARTRDLV